MVSSTYKCIVEPLSDENIGKSQFVLCSEVVLSSEVKNVLFTSNKYCGILFEELAIQQSTLLQVYSL